jgi:anti-sigma B factor antagonist
MTLAYLEDTLEVSESGSALVLRIVGELDRVSRAWIEPAVMSAIASAPCVIMDLAALTFCDSAGVAMFVAALERALSEGTHVVFRHVAGAPRRVFEVTCLDTMIDLVE